MKLKFLLFIYKIFGNANQRLMRFLEKQIAKADGGVAYSSVIRKIYKEKHHMEIGYGTYGGCWNVPAFWWRNIKIGNYCSFASNITLLTSNHTTSTFTTHPILFCPEYGMKVHLPKETYTQPEDWNNQGLTIGNDVWMGMNVVVLPSCHKIGDGAVIGAGAIVTKDVPPYAIVVGNPAKILRYRFSQKQIEQIQKTKWWLLDKNQLAEQACQLQNIINSFDHENN